MDKWDQKVITIATGAATMLTVIIAAVTLVVVFVLQMDAQRAELRAEQRADIADLRTEQRADIADLRTDLRAIFVTWLIESTGQVSVSLRSSSTRHGWTPRTRSCCVRPIRTPVRNDPHAHRTASNLRTPR